MLARQSPSWRQTKPTPLRNISNQPALINFCSASMCAWPSLILFSPSPNQFDEKASSPSAVYLSVSTYLRDLPTA